MTNSSRRSIKQTVDWKLVICYLLLVLIGWLNIYASSHASETAGILDFATRSGKQFVWILSGLGLGTLILFLFNPRLWEVISVPTYIIILFLLVAVIFLGTEVKGSRSWFQFGPISFQPAEVSKITTSLVLAAVMSRQNFKLSNIKHLLLVAAIIAVPMLTIVAESETGSALVYVGFIFVLYREGFSGWFIACIGLIILLFILTLTVSPYAAALVLIGSISFCYCTENRLLRRWLLREAPLFLLMAFLPKIWQWVGGEEPAGFFAKIKPIYVLVGCTLLAMPWLMLKAYRERKFSRWAAIIAFFAGLVMIYSTEFIFNDVLQDHQRKRIEVLLGMKEDPAGVGYNVNQSMIAIGSGGLFGKGFLHGTQTTYGFVPEQSTDFIFCTVGEEWGFVGCLVVILLYVFLIARIILDAEKCREAFSRIYGYCVASIIFMHLFINIGMTIGLMPVIGIPLPLLSYGGSSLWSFTVLIFIFLALYKEENKYF